MTSESAGIVLAITATVVVLQSVLLGVMAWLNIRMWRAARTQFDDRMDYVEGRVDGLADALRQLAAGVEQSASQTSTLIRYGERFSGALAAVATTPKAWLLARAASKLMAGWRRRRATAA